MIVSLFVFVVILVLSIPSAIIFIPLAVITGNVGPLYAVACFIVRAGFRAAGIRVRVEGRENVPAGRACIFMANHVSNLDPPGLIPRIPGRTAAFTKRSVFKLPCLRLLPEAGRVHPRGPNRQRGQRRESVAAARRMLERACTSPPLSRARGRRTDGCCLSRKGPFYLAMETGAPCIPVSVYGTETLMAKGSFAIKPGTAHFVFHAPIYPREF